ncbi:MAG: hypothetical protein PHX43_07095, partial [Alphaproteobacteria bacterium]|nr:hypothetical protein [Alphaproteobacteria bacterium]
DSFMAKWNLTRNSKAVNVSLRMLTLVAKFIFTLYIGRYFALADIGAYGLAIAAVSILASVMGQGFGFFMGREIIGEEPVLVLRKMRDQTLYYAANYIVLAVVICGLIASQATGLETSMLIYILVLAVLEGFANMTYVNLNSLNQQVLANALFFVRAGLWVFFVIALCLVNPVFRAADTILICWSIGCFISIGATVWCWRNLPWRKAMALPVDWAWIKTGVKKCLPIWLGAMGLVGGSFLDRFVVLRYLDINSVGVITFYASFATAMFSLMQSGVLAFSAPRLVALHKSFEHEAFRHEAIKSGWQAALGAGVLAVGIGIFVPAFGYFFNRPVFVAEAWTLVLMLFGVWLKVNAEVIYNILYARHQDRAIWTGNLLFLIPAVGCNFLLVPELGLSGMGYSAVISAAFLFFWRFGFVMGGAKKYFANILKVLKVIG